MKAYSWRKCIDGFYEVTLGNLTRAYLPTKEIMLEFLIQEGCITSAKDLKPPQKG